MLGRLPRVNRRIGLVVLRKSSIMLRSSAAFSKSIFFAALRISSSNVAIISLDFPSRNSQACDDTLAVLLRANFAQTHRHLIGR